MKKTNRFLFFVICFVLFTLLIGNILSAVNLHPSDKIEKRVLTELNVNAKTTVIVSFSNDLNFSDNINDVEKILGKKSKKVFSSANSFSAELTLSEIEKLSQENIVKLVSPNRQFRALLQNSVGIINATLSWTLQNNNLNLTGRGETICIIDTGVNYSQPDLGGCYGNNNVSSSCKVIGGYDYVNNDENPMDDNGHGTHVAGIAAANGAITGVAPEAKIVALKVLSGSGLGSETNVLAAIDWCVNNASKFNISVISLSLGTDCDADPEYCYSNYCDNQPIEWSYKNSINAAFAKNISVVSATGNNDNTTSFGSPACIKNATRVASVSKSDVFSTFSNRGANFQILLAPGEDINSTYLSGYYLLQGTSMATPHVSGAMAIMKQYLRAIGITKTPYEVENIFNSTGKLIWDASSAKNYSRINIYAALFNLDLTPPSVALMFPSNGTLSQGTITFRCNASDWQLSNITFYLWNLTSEVNRTSFGVSGKFNQSEINISNLPSTNYKWNCLSSDLRSNSAFASSNFSFSFGNLSVGLNLPLNNSGINNNFTYFNCSSVVSSGSILSNITFYLWNSTKSLIYNESKNISGTSNSTLFNYTLGYPGSYEWNCLAVNNISTRLFADSNFTLIYDVSSPFIDLISPSDGTSATTNEYNFTFNVTDNHLIANCTLFVDNLEYNFISNVNSGIFNGMYNSSISVGTHAWSINCSDGAGNVANSTILSFSVNSPPVVRLGGGGGSTPSAGKTYSISAVEVTAGYTQQLNANDVITFNSQLSSSGSHSVTIITIKSNFVNLILRSTPINVTLYLGQDKKVNTTGDYYDFYLKLNSIVNGKANITIKEIHEQIFKTPVKVISNTTNNTVPEIADDKNSTNYLPRAYVTGGFFIVLVVIFIIIYLMRKNKNTGSVKKRR